VVQADFIHRRKSVFSTFLHQRMRPEMLLTIIIITIITTTTAIIIGLRDLQQTGLHHLVGPEYHERKQFRCPDNRTTPTPGPYQFHIQIQVRFSCLDNLQVVHQLHHMTIIVIIVLVLHIMVLLSLKRMLRLFLTIFLGPLILYLILTLV